MVYPSFAVIIPTKDRPTSLYQCLKSLSKMDYPDWEAIVIDDGGTKSFDRISDIAWPYKLSFLSISSSGPGRARNAGVEHAKTDFVAFTDDDCRVEPNWLQAFAQHFERTGCDAIGGRSLPPAPSVWTSTAWHLVIDFYYSHMVDAAGNVLMLVSNNAAYRRDAFNRLGGYDETLDIASEDRELSVRLLSAGYTQHYEPNAIVWHYQEKPTLIGYLARQFRYGRGSYHFDYKTARLVPRLSDDFRIKGNTYQKSLPAYLRKHHIPFAVRILIRLGQVAHRSGRSYESLRSKQ